MCFSATASFVTAAITGAVGVMAIRRATSPEHLPLASAPLVFAVQQAVEGSLWLRLPQDGTNALASSLALIYLLIAQVWWPVVVPISVLLIEPTGIRRRLMTIGLTMGMTVAAYLLWAIVLREHRAEIIDGHLVYVTETSSPLTIGLAYLGATALPLLLSSYRAVAALGAVVLVGAVVTYLLYWEAFVSVWCFFAAASSGLILLHSIHQRRRSAATVPG